jgi:hypothetical protein
MMFAFPTESAYSLHNRVFMGNLRTIILYAVFGTIFNFLLIGKIPMIFLPLWSQLSFTVSYRSVNCRCSDFVSIISIVPFIRVIFCC